MFKAIPARIHVSYDRLLRLWVATFHDAMGWRLGDLTGYGPTKYDAVDDLKYQDTIDRARQS